MPRLAWATCITWPSRSSPSTRCCARDHLEQHGVAIDFEGRRRAGAQIAVEFRDPDGHHLEIYWGLDQLPSDGPVRPPEEWVEAHSLEAALDHAPPGQDTILADPSLRRR